MKMQFTNYATITGIIFIILQQSIVASSTALIAQLTQSIMSGQGYLLWLTLFVLSLTIVYIPTTLTNYFINKAQFITFNKYIASFKKQAYNHPALYFSAKFRQQKESYFTHEVWMMIQEDYAFIVDILSVFLNVALNVLVLSLYLDWLFLVSYVAAVPICIGCILLSKSHLQKKSDKMQKKRNGLLQIMASGWDTILVGNQSNMSTWQGEFNARSGQANTSQRKLTFAMDIMAMVTLALSAIPILVVLFMAFMRAEGDLAMLALLVATAPRQVLTIQYLSDIVGMFIRLNDKVRRTKQLSKTLTFSPEDLNTQVSTQGKISWGRICVGGTTIGNFEDITTATNNFAPGRYVITGNNGTGKTTLLAKIKHHLGDTAFILPAQSKLAFASSFEAQEFSTGQKLLANLDEAMKTLGTHTQVLLLDEWDANLDDKNIALANAKLDAFGKNICILEVLHVS